MEVKFKVKDDEGRRLRYFLRKYFKSNVGLDVLAKMAARELAASAAQTELNELDTALESDERAGKK